MKFHSNPILALAISSIIFPTTSFAVDNFQSCNALLQVGLYNISKSSSEEESQALQKADFCSERYNESTTSSSKAAQIKASYSAFSGSASGSATQTDIQKEQDKQCGSNYNSSYYYAQASGFAQSIHQGSLDAWNKCQDLAKSGGVQFEVTPDPSLQTVGVTLSLLTATGGGSKLLGVTQGGLGHSSCTASVAGRSGSYSGKLFTVDDKTVLPFDANNKLSIICKRELLNDGTNNFSAEEQTLYFNTPAGIYQVYLAPTGLLSHSTVDQVIANAKTAANAAVTSQISQVKTDYQKAISDASPTATLNSLQNQITGNKPVCTRVDAQSATVGCGEAIATATLPQEYTLVGGGCDSSTNLRKLIDSRPDGNGWSCWTQDITACSSGSVTASAIGCNFH